ncbi:amino acid adenylation domain-containing protein [Streptomyces kanasensis]|uniref:amino acid adenylation domain-containing protein n=1 Tax=Streptomyces kanasensis TaxID=936756 RepID=UPI0036F95316
MALPTPRPGGDDRVARWNDTAVPYPRDHCLHDLFEERAAASPTAPAVRQGGRTLTYGDLSRHSDALAGRLLAAGVRPGATVGVTGHRGPEAITAFLAVLKCGAAYVPLDDEYPPARLHAMAEDADVRVAVNLPGGTCRLRRLSARIDADLLVPRQDPVARTGHGSGPRPRPVPPAVGVSADDCAYVMFTSGSTGRPKPVAVPHRGVVRLAASGPELCPPTARDRVLHAYSCSSDASTIEIWSALLSGACLVVADRETLLSVEALERLLTAERVTVAFLTTGVFHHVARHRPTALRGLRFLSAGGEALDPRLARRVFAACPETLLVNFYGPTENSVVSTAHVVRDLPPHVTDVPIGRPFPNSTCYVTRDDGTLAGVGEAGDLLVGGDGLATGYLNDPAQTAARFIQHPFDRSPGARLYVTGDRARWREDGVLEYLGRKDRQVKVRGFRIELDEVEARLRSHPSVGEAVVDVLGEGPRAQLVAHVTPGKPNEPVAVAGLRTHLTAWLPPSAVPARIRVVSRFPMTGAGKVDRRALIAEISSGRNGDTPPAVRPRPGPNRQGERPPAEDGRLVVLADIWERSLRVRPQPSDSFFDLGGDSLLIAEVTTRTMSELRIDPAHGTFLVRSLLHAPTLEAYAAAVERTMATDPVRRRPRPGPGHTVDFVGEARLGLRMPPPRGRPPRPHAPEEVLLTGASGFVGAFLLDRFLRGTEARLLCPVRARDASHARRRVLANLARYGLSPHPHAARLHCFPADLARPRLGLSDETFADLAASADLVVHSGAHVNFLYPYTALRPANVDGTRELVRLAAGRRVPLHFLSTIAVLAGYGTAGVRRVDEDAPLDHADHLSMGYAESKWVAERMLRDAAASGLPVAVYRPYEVTGERDTGVCNTETAICSLFRVIAETGLAPDIPLPLDFVPVDHLADTILHIAIHEPADGRTYHLTNPRPARLADMLDRMRLAGYGVRLLPYEVWVEELVQHVARDPGNPTAPFVSLCVDRSNKADISVKEMYIEGVFPRLGRHNTEHVLRGTGLHCPPTDAGLLDRYLNFLRTSGYLPPPRPAHHT